MRTIKYKYTYDKEYVVTVQIANDRDVTIYMSHRLFLNELVEPPKNFHLSGFNIISQQDKEDLANMKVIDISEVKKPEKTSIFKRF